MASAAEGQPPAPVTAEQLIEARRPEDQGNSLWTDVAARAGEYHCAVDCQAEPCRAGACRPAPSASIDRSVSLNRALWVLAEEMRKLKA